MSGAKVVRFSIGFGPALFSRFDRRGTEFVVAAMPLGGYVKILDEREGEVAPHEADKTFNRLSPTWRIAFALGGPAANFLLAIVIYWALFVAGSTDVVPIIADPAPETPAFAAGLQGGEEIVSVDGAADAVLGRGQHGAGVAARRFRIDLDRESPARQRRHRPSTECRSHNWQRGADEPELFRSLGMVPTLAPILGTILDDGPAKAAGLQSWRSRTFGGRQADQGMG